MKNHGRKPTAVQQGWKSSAFRSLPVLTHRFVTRTASWWLDVPRDQWAAVVQDQIAGMAGGRYGLIREQEREWE